MDPFIICISETLPIRPFPSSYLASAQWISIQGRIIKEVPKQCDIRAILEIAHEVLAGRKVIGAPGKSCQ